MKVIVDCKELLESDDGNTTTYNGYVKVNNEEISAYGNDRGDSYHYDVYYKVAELFGAPIEAAEYLLDSALENMCSLKYFEISGEKFKGENTDDDLSKWVDSLKVVEKQYKMTITGPF